MSGATILPTRDLQRSGSTAEDALTTADTRSSMRCSTSQTAASGERMLAPAVEDRRQGWLHRCRWWLLPVPCPLLLLLPAARWRAGQR